MVNHSNAFQAGDRDVYIVIVAAGSGTRFGAAIPKQFLPLDGVPVLVRTVTRMQQALPQAQTVLVLSEDGRERWQQLSAQSEADGSIRPCHTVLGGADRTSSVRNALQFIRERLNGRNAFILVHDGARPMVHPDVICAVVEELHKPDVKAVVPVLPLTEALAKCSDSPEVIEPTPRSDYRTVQTPQGFDAHTLFAAYDATEGTAADDATVVAEHTDETIHTVPGHIQNIKITNPSDIAIAGIFLANPLPY